MLLRIGLAFLILLFTATIVLAQDVSPNAGSKEGHGSIGSRLGFYYNGDDGDGNPFLDEELTVIEPTIFFDYNVTNDTNLWGKFSYDYVSSASIDRLSNFPEQSGASGDYYFGLDVGANHELSDTERVGGFLGASVEYDYRSFGLGGHYGWDTEDKNNTFKVSANGFFDQLDIIRFNGIEEGTDTRISLTAGGTWYHVFSPTLHGEFGANLTFQSGFLETPYNAVVVEDPTLPPNPNLVNNANGREIPEELDDTRLRLAVFGRLKRYIKGGHAVGIGGRLYSDTWGITGISLEPSFETWLINEKLSSRLRYRFYTQTAADDFQESFTEETSQRTQDSDLGDFTSHSVGLKFDWHISNSLVWDIGGDYVLRDDGLDQILFSSGFRKEF
jgi:hypothetical protein